jgi:hypothetical protein
MKFTAFITNDDIQLNLQAESPHEEELLKLLRECHGAIKIHHGVNVMDIGRCQGGYLRAWEPVPERCTAIKIERESPAPPQVAPTPPDPFLHRPH